MKLIGLDFETYYEQGMGPGGYSLRNMTMEEYVRDERFEVITMAVATPTTPGWSTRAPADEGIWLKAQNWDDYCVVSWNAQFDGAILAWRYGVRPRMILCAMAMWRMMGYGRFGGESLDVATRYAVENGWAGVVQKGQEIHDAANKRWSDFSLQELNGYRRYCQEDAKNALTIAQHLMAKGFPKSELIPMAESIRAFTEPRLVLDTPVLQKVADKRRAHIDRTVAAAGVDDIAVLRSDAKFALALQSMGYEPEFKVNAKGERKHAFAKTDTFMQEGLEGGDEVLSALIEARLASKSNITESRSQRLIDISKRGRFPVFLKSGGAHTIRYSGGDKVNPQNFSKIDGTRNGITVPPGFVLLDPDSSQIEARFVAYDCGQDDLVEDFRNKVDIYCKFGNNSGVFPFEVTKATESARFISKGIVLGGGYGAGYETMRRQTRNLAFALGLKVDMDVDFKALNDAYRNQNKRIRNVWYRLNDALRQLIILPVGESIEIEKITLHRDSIGPGAKLPNGLMIYYHNLRVDPEDDEVYYDKVKGRNLVKARIYGAKVLENHTQGVAGVTIREQWAKIVTRARKELGIKYGSIVLQVHDALMAMVKKEVADDYSLIMVEEMRRPPVWAPGVPLDCEMSRGQNYGEMEVVKM